MASTYLSRTTGTPTLGTKVTVSAWIKISEVPGGGGSDRWLFGEYGNNSNHSYLYLRNSSEIGWYEADGSGTVASIITNRLCRDLSGWYHFMIAYDTTLATQADRFKLYINGERETSFSTNTNSISQNYTPRINRTGRTYYIGGTPSYQTKFYGLMSHINHCDGQALAPTVFGSTDALTGEWKINASPTFTPGNNGFSILKDGNTITDQSANSNNFTLAGGTLTKSEDNPSNNFATFTTLQPTNSTTFSHGNTTLVSGSTQWNGAMTTIPLFKGKWYYECKYNTGGNLKLSVVGNQADYRNFKTLNSAYGEYHGNGYGYQFNNSGNDYLGNNNSSPSWGGGLSSNSGNKIYMVALDLDNGKIWYGADGTWFDDASGNTGNPSTGAHAHQTMTADHLSQKPHIVTGSVEGSGMTGNWNFGNGYFGTTAVSSAGSNASNIGIFEYDVPTGFTAITTKGLNE